MRAKQGESLLAHLCCMCGAVSLERDWTYWAPAECVTGDENAVGWAPAPDGWGDPMALCPVCKWEHQDTDDGSGFYQGTLAEMEAQREVDLPEMGEWWAHTLTEARS